MSNLPSQYLVIDEEGYPLVNEVRASADVGSDVLRHIRFAENGAFESEVAGQRFLIEAFDEPFVAHSLSAPNKNSEKIQFWKIQLPFGVEKNFRIHSLRVDDWDRFHGLTTEGIPFLLSEDAQAQLFEIADSYDDDSITIDSKIIPVPYLFAPEVPVDTEEYWTNIYLHQTPKWDLAKPTPILTQLLTRLKIPKSRVLVLGCGKGHDAAYFAQQGHFVTAVDISPEALQQARALYGTISNLQFVQHDIFDLPREWEAQFDLIFEHTCYCAVNPSRRSELAKIWRRLLAPNGHLLGVFFTAEHRNATPFGATEWEIRERVKNHFHFIFWGRWRTSIDNRDGKELAVYIQKKSL
jgi:SAM-dependent methyltransferase